MGQADPHRDSPPLRIGTRGSALALWQANFVRDQLQRRGWPARLEIITTSGDRFSARVSALGGKGLFTREIEEALLAHRIDLAVHSLKDVPAQLPEGLVLGAIPERGDPRDVLLAGAGVTLRQLAHGACVGTSSLRRQAQLLALRPDLKILPWPGNIDTRLRRWRDGGAEAIVLAAAGLARLAATDGISEWFAPADFLPAAGQGALAIECRASDAGLLSQLRQLHHPLSAHAVAAERAVLKRLGAGCHSALAAHAAFEHGSLHLRARLFSPDGRECLQAEEQAALSLDAGNDANSLTFAAGALELGARVAADLERQGAQRLLQFAAVSVEELP